MIGLSLLAFDLINDIVRFEIVPELILKQGSTSSTGLSNEYFEDARHK